MRAVVVGAVAETRATAKQNCVFLYMEKKSSQNTQIEKKLNASEDECEMSISFENSCMINSTEK